MQKSANSTELSRGFPERSTRNAAPGAPCRSASSRTSTRLPPGHSSCRSGHSASGVLNRMVEDAKPCPEPSIRR